MSKQRWHVLGLTGAAGSGAALGRNMPGLALERCEGAPLSSRVSGTVRLLCTPPLLVVPRGGNVSFAVCLTVKILISPFYWSC